MKKLITVFGLLVLVTACSEVTVVRKSSSFPVCNYNLMHLEDYKRLQTKTGAIYVHKYQNYVCESTFVGELK